MLLCRLLPFSQALQDMAVFVEAEACWRQLYFLPVWDTRSGKLCI